MVIFHWRVSLPEGGHPKININNGKQPFEDVFPSKKKWWFSIDMLLYQKVVITPKVGAYIPIRRIPVIKGGSL